MSYSSIGSKFCMLLAATVVFAAPAEAKPKDDGGGTAPEVQYVFCAENIAGPGVGSDFPGCSEALALGFAVDRELPDDPGGTEPINLGVGDLTTLMLKKASNLASSQLFQFSVNGNSFGNAEIFCLEERTGWPGPLTTLEVKLDRSFVKSMKFEENQLIENLELFFSKIQLTYFERDESGGVLDTSVFCWDQVNRIPCTLD